MVTCLPSSSSQTVEVEEDSEITFRSGPGRKTEHNVDCRVLYQLGTCARVELSCYLKMKGRGKNCSRGDRLSLSYGGQTFQ